MQSFATKAIIKDTPTEKQLWHLITNLSPKRKLDPFTVQNVKQRRAMFKFVKGGK